MKSGLRALRILLCTSLALLALSSSDAAGQVSESDRILGAARRLQIQGELDAAAGLLAPLFEEDPTHTMVFLTYYRLLEDLGRTGDRRATLERRLEALPEDPTALGLKGDLLMERGDRDAAMALWERMPRGAPRDPGVWRMAGARMQAAGAQEEALRLYRRAKEALEDPVALAPEIARALRDLGRHQEAAHELFDYLEREPDRLPTVQTLLAGFPYGGTLAEELAAEAAERAGRTEVPAHFHRLAGQIHLYAQQPEKALPHYLRADRVAGARGMFLTELARTAAVRGSWETAERAWQAVLEEEPSPPLAASARLERGRALLRLERAAEAMASLRPLVEEPPSQRFWPEGVRLFAQAAREEGQTDDARWACRRLTGGASRPEQRLEGWLGLGELSLAAGEPDSALGFFEEAVQEGTGDPRAGLGVARTLLYLGRVEAAGERIRGQAVEGGGGELTSTLQLFRRARLLESSRGGAARFGRALLAAQGGRHAEAAAMLTRLEEEVEGAAREEVLFARARSEAARGDTLAAAAAWDRAAVTPGALQPDRSRYEAGRILISRDAARARSELETLMETYPASPWIERARVLLRRIVEGPR